MILRLFALTAALLPAAGGCKDEKTIYVDAAVLEVEPAGETAFPPEGGTVRFSVRTNMSVWDVVCPAEWLRADKTAEGFALTAEPNLSAEARKAATLAVTAGDGFNGTDETITVRQAGLEKAVLTVYPSGGIAFAYAGGTRTVEVETNQSEWNASADADWLTVDTGENSFTVTAAPNGSPSARPEAVVTVTAGPEYNRAEIEITVIQTEKPASSGTDLSLGGTSNCYIVPAAGAYLFNAAAMGNNKPTAGISPSPIVPVSAELLWQDCYSEGEGLIRSLTLEGNYVRFETYGAYHAGNAVVAVRDASGDIAWSWHLWFTDDMRALDLEDKAGGSGVSCTIMDRNLGAVSAAPGDGGAPGLLYQWGRKDPFIGGNGKGSPERTMEAVPFAGSDAKDRSATSYTYDIDGNVTNSADRMEWKVAKGGVTVEDAVRNPMTFYHYDKSAKPATYDWLGEPDHGLWGNPWEGSVTYPLYTERPVNSGAGDKSVYDPCPPGYRVAPMDTWPKAGTTKTGGRAVFDASAYGFHFNIVAGGSGSLWFPLAGCRSHMDGGMESLGSAGYLWSSSPYGAADDQYGHYSACISSSAIAFSIVGLGDRSRAYPVRCCKE